MFFSKYLMTSFFFSSVANRWKFIMLTAAWRVVCWCRNSPPTELESFCDAVHIAWDTRNHIIVSSHSECILYSDGWCKWSHRHRPKKAHNHRRKANLTKFCVFSFIWRSEAQKIDKYTHTHTDRHASCGSLNPRRMWIRHLQMCCGEASESDVVERLKRRMFVEPESCRSRTQWKEQQHTDGRQSRAKQIRSRRQNLSLLIAFGFGRMGRKRPQRGWTLLQGDNSLRKKKLVTLVEWLARGCCHADDEITACKKKEGITRNFLPPLSRVNQMIPRRWKDGKTFQLIRRVMEKFPSTVIFWAMTSDEIRQFDHVCRKKTATSAEIFVDFASRSARKTLSHLFCVSGCRDECVPPACVWERRSGCLQKLVSQLQ